jgi:hypothetical protein
MQVFQHHVIFDEVTYDREELFKWYLTYSKFTEYFSDWLYKSTGGHGVQFRGVGESSGFKVLDINNTLGKWIKDEPCIKKLLDQWAFKDSLRNLDVDVLIYPKNYSLKPHVDAAMQCGIMYPIFPNKPAPIDFYICPIGSEIIPGKEYDVNKEVDLDYSYSYSSIHPSMFNGGSVIHGVTTADQERVFLRIKIMNLSFEEIISANKQQRLFI